jgi:hypothetical protein
MRRRSPLLVVSTPGRRQSSGIYGTVVTAAVLATGGNQLGTVPLAVTILVTLLIYWLAELYAELLGQHVQGGRLPTRRQARLSLVETWPMVSASYVPLLALLLARVVGVSIGSAVDIALAVTVGLLTFYGWSGGRRAQLRGVRLVAVTALAGALGIVMIVLKSTLH